MFWNASQAVKYAKSHAAAGSLGLCAQYTRQAIEAGGVTLDRHGSAKDYGPSLTKVGFIEYDGATLRAYQAGDVVVIQNCTGHPHGHMAIHDGTQWISDFKQSELYPGSGYRTAKPAFKIYRYPIFWDGIQKPDQYANYA